MYMYAVSIAEGPDDPFRLSDFVLRTVIASGSKWLRVVYSESRLYPEKTPPLVLHGDTSEIMSILRYMQEDEGFLTLGWDNELLIIPFEGDHFNLVFKNPFIVLREPGIQVVDATEVLHQYQDAYEGFGVKRVFPRFSTS